MKRKGIVTDYGINKEREALKRQGTGFLQHPLFVSDYKKKANDFQMAKDYMDYLDVNYQLDEETIKAFQEYYELHAGRWKAIESINPSLEIMLGGENIVLGTGKLHHYPIIDRVSKSTVSEIQMQGLNFTIKDTSAKARNFRERERLARIKNYFQVNFVQPVVQQIQMEAEMNFGPNENLNQQQVSQKENFITQGIDNALPDEIKNSLNRIHTPDELVVTALVKEGMRETKLKEKVDLNAEHAVVTANKYYRLDIVNKKPYVETLNPKWVYWMGSEHVINSEDGFFAKYTQYLTPEDALSKYGYYFTKADIKRLGELFSPIPSINKRKEGEISKTGIRRKVVDFFTSHPELNESINPKTREGQYQLNYIYSNFIKASRDGLGIKETYITWKWMRRIKFVKRVVNGKLDILIRDEHYVKDPLAGDIEVKDGVIPQVWHGVKLGDEFYINVGPVEWQYNNLRNPFDVKLTIYGGTFNTFQNNVKNASLVALGMPWQYKYNVLMKKMEEHQATDLGKIFLGTTTMIPKNWTWSQWYKSLFVARTAIIQSHKGTINQNDMSVFRSIDLGRADTIASDIQQLEYIENKIITSMHSSPQKIGEIGQYATNQNTVAAIQGVDKQLYRFFNRNRQIDENMLNGFMKLCVYAYKDDEEVKATVLDDFLKAHYELNFDSIMYSNFNLYVVNDYKEKQKLEELRQLALTMLQNGLTPGQLAKIYAAETVAELLQFLEDVDIKLEKKAQEEYQQKMAMIEKENEKYIIAQREQQAYLASENEKERIVRLKMAELNSLQLEKANDVNENKINDAYERSKMEMEFKERIEDKKLDLEKYLGEKEIAVKEKALNKK